MMSLVVRIMRLALPFWEEVYGQDMRNWTPWERKKAREVELSNSLPLSHWTALMVRPNRVDTQAKKWRRVGKASDLAHRGKVHE